MKLLHMLYTASVCSGAYYVPNADLVFHNATEAQRTGMPQHGSILVERGPGYRCNGTDRATCAWVPDALYFFH